MEFHRGRKIGAWPLGRFNQGPIHVKACSVIEGQLGWVHAVIRDIAAVEDQTNRSIRGGQLEDCFRRHARRESRAAERFGVNEMVNTRVPH